MQSRYENGFTFGDIISRIITLEAIVGGHSSINTDNLTVNNSAIFNFLNPYEFLFSQSNGYIASLPLTSLLLPTANQTTITGGIDGIHM